MYGIYSEFIASYLPNGDGVAKHDIKINIEKLRLLIAACNLPKKL